MTDTAPAKPRALPAEVRRSLQRIKLRVGASELDLKRVTMRYALDHGWRRFHPLPAVMGSGRMVTPFEGEPGFPDLTLVRAGRLVLAELKDERGSESDQQQMWSAALRAVPGIEVYLWRPRHWDTIRRTLR